MENKDELLRNLGFSNEYIKVLEESEELNTKGRQAFHHPARPVFNDSINITSLIIDKSEKPISSFFVFNEK